AAVVKIHPIMDAVLRRGGSHGEPEQNDGQRDYPAAKSHRSRCSSPFGFLVHPQWPSRTGGGQVGRGGRDGRGPPAAAGQYRPTRGVPGSTAKAAASKFRSVIAKRMSAWAGSSHKLLNSPGSCSMSYSSP